MATHTCQEGQPGILHDGCDRCKEHAESALLLDLDRDYLSRLWEKMYEVEYEGGGYQSSPDKQACTKLYALSIWLQRNLGMDVRHVTEILQQNASVTPL